MIIICYTFLPEFHSYKTSTMVPKSLLAQSNFSDLVAPLHFTSDMTILIAKLYYPVTCVQALHAILGIRDITGSCPVTAAY